MTIEDKELLLKDLCARLPYGVICFAPDYEYGDIGKLWCIEPFEDLDPQITVQYPRGNTITKFCSEVKPYLRPMSSMTEEERKEFSVFIGRTERYTQQICLDADSMTNPIIGGYKCVYWGLFDKCIDWLNKHHFDYRRLIEKGLALEAPEGMYNIKEK